MGYSEFDNPDCEGGKMNFQQLVILIIITALAFQGCGKKKENLEDTEFAAQKTDEKKDEPDIFDEFYDDAPGADGSAPKKEETFSTSPSFDSGQFSETGPYVVQVSCVRSSALADRHVQKLRDSGYPAYSAEVENPTPDLMGTFYRVRVGGFDGVSQAKSFGENALLAAGYEYWVDNKSNDNVGMEGYGLGQSQPSTYDDYSSDYSTPSSSTPSSDDSWGAQPAAESESPAPAAEIPPEPEPIPESEPLTAPATSAEETAPVPEPEAPAAQAPEQEIQQQTQEQAPVSEETVPAGDAPAEDDWGDSDWGDDSWGSESSDSDW